MSLIVSEKRHSFDSKYRYVLFPLALLYWGILFWRNLFYMIGFFVSKRLPCKVVSVGNLTAGGTGKTPAVIYLANLIKSTGKSVAVLSRGYGRKTSGTQLVTDGISLPKDWHTVGDEPTFMAQSLKGVPVAVDENRYRGGTYLVQRFNPDVIILDDAFQHRALIRDVDIVLLNSRDAPADHKLLPYGILREPWIHLSRADVLFFTKTNLNPPPTFLKHKVRATKLPYFYSIMKPADFVTDRNRQKKQISELKEKNILAFSGIGDPSGFLHTLKKTGIYPIETAAFPDHYVYTPRDIEELRKQYERVKGEGIITTEKDWIKLKELDLKDLPIFSLPIQFIPDRKGKEKILTMIFN